MLAVGLKNSFLLMLLQVWLLRLLCLWRPLLLFSLFLFDQIDRNSTYII